MTSMDCWRGFAAAIVDRALKDRTDAAERLAVNPGDRVASRMMEDVGRFLSSEWAEALVWFSPRADRERFSREVAQ